MPASIFDRNANIEAVALRWDEGSETWDLLAVGSPDECRETCRRSRAKGTETELVVYVTDELIGAETF